ncbi:MAG: NADP-dependent phosphogluconate dehydrogenase, partial [Saprospiraceae bacterium]|nr:NADP-dependent phosphogluconate dehydrogenase [Saprospiraceae bacterium]
MKAQVIILYGVSGSGKTTIGLKLSERLGLPFYDADDFHPEQNIKKMASGLPLDDNDRMPWLETLAKKIRAWQSGAGAILSCSALKESYRALLDPKGIVNWVLLYGDQELIEKRISDRQNHYMKAVMLQSQFDTLEIPEYGLKINIDQSPGEIINKIIQKLNTLEKSKVGLIGLGVMGSSLSLNIADKGHSISVYNRSIGDEAQLLSNFMDRHSQYSQIQGYSTLDEFVESLETPRKIILMIKAGQAIDHVIKDLLPYLDDEDIIIDGGNSHYQDTKRRHDKLLDSNIHFIGSGVSGGEEGARKGPSIMPGGSAHAYAQVAPILESIAAVDARGRKCCTYIGPDGAGHFVKMIHNGIEYAEMQLIAEMYALLSTQYSYAEISELFTSWNTGDLGSYLLEISASILQKKEGDHYLIDLILDKAGNKGTGSWSSKAGFDLGIPVTMMSDAVYARYISSFKDTRIKLSEQLGQKRTYNKPVNLTKLENAYRTARILNHHQGFHLIKQASDAYDWNINLSDLARIWTNGCIIRSAFMNEAIELFQSHDSILDNHKNMEAIGSSEEDLKEVVSSFLENRVHAPVFSSGLQYWIASTTENLSANFIQAQRDFFGAHRYQRIDE